MIESSQVCAGWKPVFVSKHDIFTEETARQILSHNRFGEKQNCW